MGKKDKMVIVSEYVGEVSSSRSYSNMAPEEIAATEAALKAGAERITGGDKLDIRVATITGAAYDGPNVKADLTILPTEPAGTDDDRRASVVSEVLDILRLKVAYYDPLTSATMRPIGTLNLEGLRALAWEIVGTVLPRG